MKQYLYFILIGVLLQQAQSWTVLESNGPVPSERNSGAMQVIGDDLVLFGGFKECFNFSICQHEFYNDIWHYNLNNNTWYKPSVSPDPVHGFPGPRAYIGNTVDEDEQALVIYGGASYKEQVEFDFNFWFANAITYDDMWYYYPHQARWEKIEYADQPGNPGIRAGAGILKFGNNLILTSGIRLTFFQSIEDTWKFNLATREWTQLTGKFSDTHLEHGRYIFPFVKSGNRAYVFSGNVAPTSDLLGVQYQDVYEYKVSINKWTKILPFNNTGFTGRVHGGMVAYEDHLYAFFGDDNDNANECRMEDNLSSGHSAIDETWAFKVHPVQTRAWRLSNDPASAPSPLKRVFYAFDQERGRILVWGGFNVECEGHPDSGQLVWNTDLLSQEISSI